MGLREVTPDLRRQLFRHYTSVPMAGARRADELADTEDAPADGNTGEEETNAADAAGYGNGTSEAVDPQLGKVTVHRTAMESAEEVVLESTYSMDDAVDPATARRLAGNATGNASLAAYTTTKRVRLSKATGGAGVPPLFLEVPHCFVSESHLRYTRVRGKNPQQIGETLAK